MTDRKPYATGREFGLGWPLEPTESETESWIQLANGLVLALAAGFFISWLLLLVLGLKAGFGLHASLVLGIVSCLVIAFSLRRSRVELREELGDLEQIGESGRSRLVTSDQIHGLYHEILKDAQIGWYRLGPGGVLEAASPTTSRLLGYSTPEAMKAEYGTRPFPTGDDRDPIERTLRATGEIRGLAATWLTRDGHPVRVVETARILRDEFGRDLCTEGFVRFSAATQVAAPALRSIQDHVQPAAVGSLPAAHIGFGQPETHAVPEGVETPSAAKADVFTFAGSNAGLHTAAVAVPVGMSVSPGGGDAVATPYPAAAVPDPDDITHAVRRQLERHHGGEPAFMADLLSGFSRTANQLQFSLAEQLEHSDFKAMSETARSLKASCHFVGLGRLAALCKTLESTVRSSPSRTETEPLIRAIRNELETIQPLLFAERKRLLDESSRARAA